MTLQEHQGQRGPDARAAAPSRGGTAHPQCGRVAAPLLLMPPGTPTRCPDGGGKKSGTTTSRYWRFDEGSSLPTPVAA